MSTSPTARSLALLREEGCLAAIVERWNHHVGIRQDLFGFVDVLGLRRDGAVVFVQSTTASNLASRVTKAEALSAFHLVLELGHVVEFHGWAKRGPRGGRKTWHVVRRVCRGGAPITDLA